MSYHGGQNWSAHHDPPSAHARIGPDIRSQTMQNGSPSNYQPPPDVQHGHAGQHQNPLLQYTLNNMPTGQSTSSSRAPASAQGPAQQPQFINPAQLFSQQSASHLSQPLHDVQQISNNRQAVHAISKPSPQMLPRQSSNTQLDQPMLLMSLAEEFFDAAHELAPSVSLSMVNANVGAYEKLISTGLGCLDTALKHVKLPPRAEANIRLRYAGVLYEETENYMEAETALSKGLVLCERVGSFFSNFAKLSNNSSQHHYYDLKYAMQFLLAQFMFKKNPKASLKALDNHISDAEA